MKKVLIIAAIALLSITAIAQEKRDTVIVELAKTSRVIFTIQDRKDLEVLKNYNYNELFKNILTKLENNDTTALAQDSTRKEGDSEEVYWTREGDDRNHNDDDDDNDDNNGDWHVHHGRRWGRTWQSFNFDLGTNNYLQDGDFPSGNSNYAVRPWGSWYVGMSSIQRSRLGKKFFLEWGLGVSWYNFKFQEDNILIQKTDDGVQFVQDTRDVDFIKSKLTASYVTASLIPVIDFGDNSRKSRVWENDGESFRIGLGPYIGYRISSHSKLVYKDDGREKEKDRDSFYLNNFRYGARLQIGYRSTDLFFNYDINELFEEGKGPKLNAFSFGVIF